MNYFPLIYFAAGIAQDFLFTLSLRFVHQNKAFRASLCSFTETVVTLMVLYDILNRLEGQRGMIGIVSYALGIGVGTFLAMKFKLGTKQS